MDNILLLDTSIASDNIGDAIIMECVRKELEPLLMHNYVRTLPTHVSAFHWYQVLRGSNAVRSFSEAKLKFVGGSNLLVPDLLTHYPQWNINICNYQPLKNSILVGVGAGAGAESGSNWYTRYVYQHLLHPTIYHSARDERSKKYIESLGLKAINTGCVTMWMLTPDFCKMIPTKKADRVVFTLTAHDRIDTRDQYIINTLLRNYSEIYFWPQGIKDYDYFHALQGVDGIRVLPATKEAYDNYLNQNDTDYVGTRLHGGVYSMRHKRRSIIIAIDERARAINEKNHLNCVDLNHIEELNQKISSVFDTRIEMDYDAINMWKKQFLL